MDGDRFDSLSRMLATAASRRAALKAAFGLLGAFGLRAGAGAQVSQAACGNVVCTNSPGRCNPGCVCCVYGNGNSRCLPAGGCSGGSEVCPPDRPFVDRARGCVACLTAGNCPPPAGSCQLATCTAGVCGVGPAPEGTACDDGNPCTVPGTCRGGACVAGPAVDCAAQGDACNDGVCRSSDGACVKQPKTDGTGCDADGDACTAGDSCQAGACVPGPAVVCAAAGECRDAGVCDPATGLCSNPAKADGTSCGGEIGGQVCCGGACCAVGEECIAGVCRGDCVAVGGTCADESECCQDRGFAGCEGEVCCFALEEGCAADGECCSGRCNGDFCCVRPGGGCDDDGQCCGGGLGACRQGVCACTEIGSACAGTAECCDGLACTGGSCQPTGCLSLTERCQAAGQCCDTRSLCAEGRVGGGPICCLAPGQTCESAQQCCGFASVCAAGTCCQAEGGACNSSLANTGCCAGLTCTGVNGTCALVCPIDSRVCGIGCCPLGQECCNGVCCGANQDCRNLVCRDCLAPGTTCDPANNVCCQDQPTFCFPEGVVSTVARSCCRPVGGSCVQSNDVNGVSDCCLNIAESDTGLQNCGRDGICGGPNAVCFENSHCVSGDCRGRCSNQFPVKPCLDSFECDCEGDLEDGCVQPTGICRNTRCL